MRPATTVRHLDSALIDPRVTAEYSLADDSVQRELRLCVLYSVVLKVDHITPPKARPQDHPLWQQFFCLGSQIRAAALLVPRTKHYHDFRANSTTKVGQAARSQEEQRVRAEWAAEFLSAYRQAVRRIPAARKQVAALQAQQMALLPQMRAANLGLFRERKQEISAQRARDAEALESGRFWEASRDAIKDYFHPPFRRNYLSDVSERWRAALYTEMEDTAWKAGRGDWRHKNIGTGRGYLCGIDDNGYEWGHQVDVGGYLGVDRYGDLDYAGVTVEQAMASLFGIRANLVSSCSRQGDLLFCPVTIRRDDIELHRQDEPWEIRESHTVQSVGLLRNGDYFSSPNAITVTHTSHAELTLPAGDYRVYRLLVAGAD